MFGAFLSLVAIGAVVGWAGFWAYERYDQQAERIAQLEVDLSGLAMRVRGHEQGFDELRSSLYDLRGEGFVLVPFDTDLSGLDWRVTNLARRVARLEDGLDDLEEHVYSLRGLHILVPGQNDLGGLTKRVGDLERSVATP